MSGYEGVRVLRGPDWDQGDTDGGEGYLGTVTSLLGDHRVRVHWDMGQDSTCRAGHDGKCDVIVFDTAPAEVRHPDTQCAHCGERDICGLLWRCQVCTGCDLCTPCYSDDKHDLRHQFMRIDVPGGEGKLLRARKTSVKVRAIGIFPGSKVVRGKDWQRGNEDGSEGSEGEVKGHDEASTESPRTLVAVEWATGVVKGYRLGCHGHVDLRCVEEEVGPYFYRDHLPLLDTRGNSTLVLEKSNVQECPHCGKMASEDVTTESARTVDEPLAEESAKSAQHDNSLTITMGGDRGLPKTTNAEGVVTKAEEPSGCPGTAETVCIPESAEETEQPRAKVGDRVAICVGDEKLIELQRGCGGCTARMLRCIGKTGEVTSVSDTGVVSVKFGAESKVSYRFNPLVLIKVAGQLSVGGRVRVRHDGSLVRLLNTRLGWQPQMDRTLNKVGRIIKVDDNGDLHVDFNGSRFVFAPACCLPLSEDDVSSIDDVIAEGAHASEISNPADRSKDPSQNLQLFQAVRGMVTKEDTPHTPHTQRYYSDRNLFGAISVGSADDVRRICQHDRAMVEVEVQQMTPLVYASLRGERHCMMTLLQLGADVNRHAPSDCRRTPMSAAIEGKDPSVVEILLQHGASTSYMYSFGHTAVHLAVIKDTPVVLTLLAQYGADMNLKDDFEDTALHMAVERRHQGCVEVLVDMPQVDLHAVNQHSMTALHLSCVTDNPQALAKVLSCDRSGVERLRKHSPALHIAASNDHVTCVRLLVMEGGADINRREEDKRLTALHVACHCAHLQTAEALLEMGAEVNLQDSDVDTPLHLAVGGFAEKDPQSEKAAVETACRVQIANMLISRGAFVDARDNNGKHPFQFGTHRVREGARTFVANNRDIVQWQNKELSRLPVEEALSFFSSSSSSSSRETRQRDGQLREALKGVGLPCGVCGSPKSDVTLLPCQHKCVCSACSVKVTLCPLCDEKVKEKVCTGQDEQTVDPEACKQM